MAIGTVGQIEERDRKYRADGGTDEKNINRVVKMKRDFN